MEASSEPNNKDTQFNDVIILIMIIIKIIITATTTTTTTTKADMLTITPRVAPNFTSRSAYT